MRSCGRVIETGGPLKHVLSGGYPEDSLNRMSLMRLKQFVNSLVRHTVTNECYPAKKPQWWPNSIHYYKAVELQFRRDITRLTLKQIIQNCSIFFRKSPSSRNNQYLSQWNDENRKYTKRRSSPLLVDPIAKPKSNFSQTPQQKSPTQQQQQLSQDQFLNYFELENNKMHKKSPRCIIKPSCSANSIKFSNCTNIPFSSDIGVLLANREHHQISDDLKLKRLEKTEWYVNKTATKTDSRNEFEITQQKEMQRCHKYTYPKRQNWHKRPPLHHTDFLRYFCKPLIVKLTRLNLKKLQEVEKRDKRKELVVLLENKKLLVCDKSVSSAKKRTSPRLTDIEKHNS